MPTAEPDLALLYRDTRGRLSDLLLSLDAQELAAPVPACPGWTVADVSYHLFGVVEDVLAGRLTRPPTDAETAVQVERHRGRPVAEVVSAWEAAAAPFEELIGGAKVWPAVLDVATHEQDIRGALGRPGGRDSEAVRVGADGLLGFLELPAPVRFECEDLVKRVGPEDAGEDEIVLRTTRFETLRWRLGRRSRAQMERADWSGDPAPVLDHLFVFGPSPHDIIE